MSILRSGAATRLLVVIGLLAGLGFLIASQPYVYAAGSAASAGIDLDTTGNTVFPDTSGTVGDIDTAASIGIGDSITVDFVVKGAVNLSAVNATIGYDPAVIELQGFTVFSDAFGYFFVNGGVVPNLPHAFDDPGMDPLDTDGTFDIVEIVAFADASSGDGMFIRLTFRGVGAGASTFTIVPGAAAVNGMFSDESGDAAGEFNPVTIPVSVITVTVPPGTITVQKAVRSSTGGG